METKNKVKVKFAGINFNGDECYVSETGIYFAKLSDGFYSLNSCPELGLEGIDGEPAHRIKDGCLEIIN